MRALAVARAALATERAGPRPARRNRDELAFLPAALEVIETPPLPAARAVAWTVIAFFVIAFGWACVGRVDVVAVAEGRLVPNGRTKLIQPKEIGVVRSILVRDGSVVRQGDVLVELDPTEAGAERERLAQELLTARITIARLSALLEGGPLAEGAQRFRPPEDADDRLVATQRTLLASEIGEIAARQRQLADERDRRRADRSATQVALARLDKAIPLLRQRTEARGELAEKGFGSKLQYLELEQQLVEHQHERIIQGHRLTEAEAAIAALESQSRQIEAEFRRTKMTELNDAERRAVSLAQELIKAEQRQSLQTLVAPIDGVVQQLAIHTIGGVVTPAQQLMAVVPAEDGIELEAMVLNKDIGFVRVGQEAEVKLETFNFTRYGTIPAEVLSVSGDAIMDEKRGLLYSARVRLLRTTMQIGGRPISLAPGMNATVEIKTDHRRIIEYVLSPLLRYRQESLRER